MTAKTTPPLFHRAHYNIIAARIREQLTEALDFYNPGFKQMQNRSGEYYAVDALVKLALAFAKRLKEDNPNFEPITWLNNCSPNKITYPLGELWK